MSGPPPFARSGEPAPPGRQMLSVVIPILNEEKGLDSLIARLVPVLERCGLAWETIFVDDGSTDGTLARLRAIHDEEPRMKAVSLSRNFGKEIAAAAGLRYANGDAVVLMDGDLQHPPEVIPELVAGWRQGCDIVYAQRVDRAADSLLRRLLSRAYYLLFRVLSGTKLPENAGDFRLISRRAVDALNRMDERARFNKGLFAWIGFTSMGVPFEVPERSAGDTSRWHLRRLLHFALDGVVSFSTIPLRVWSYLGLAISLITFLYIAFFVLDTMINGTDLRGFPTLVVSIMFFAGVQLISLGVIGEYLGRIYEEVKARPLYVVSEELGLDDPSEAAGDHSATLAQSDRATTAPSHRGAIN
jgi:polyisoprenyl-phosphate glycosyltransferase